MKFTKRDRLKLLLGAGGLALTGCSGGGAGTPTPSPAPTPTPTPTPTPPPTPTPTPVSAIKDVFAASFPIGAAVGLTELDAASEDRALVEAQFSSLVAENIMKPSSLAPSAGNYDFTAADQIVDFAEANSMAVRGHTLLWHRQTPDYFFEGQPNEVRSRLEDYIDTVAGRYAGRIGAWDVVNEVISDAGGGTAPYRDSNWLNAAGGSDYIEWAFRAARAADPNAKLFINDYNTELSGKRGRLLDVVRDLLDRGVPLDGVGHQFHINLSTTAEQVLDALQAVEDLGAGLENHVTELDISVYKDPVECFSDALNCEPDYGNALPTEVEREQAELYRALFDGFQDFDSLTSVTFWGVSDAQSWLNGYPVDRTNYPLLFDRNRAAKPAFFAVTDPTYAIP